MPMRPPSRCPSCRVLQTEPGRCADCRSEQRRASDARRGTFRQRGYDARHDTDAVMAKRMAVAERRPCPRCGERMLPGDALDYGHEIARSIDPTSRASRVEHAHCNRSAGARHG